MSMLPTAMRPVAKDLDGLGGHRRAPFGARRYPELANSTYEAGAPIADLSGDGWTVLIDVTGKALVLLGSLVPLGLTFAMMPCSSPEAST